MRTPNLGSVQYAPGPVPVDAEGMRRYIEEELGKMSAAINALAAGHLDAVNVAPTKPRTGDLRMADGTSWNPGYGAGVYCYYSGAWNFLSGGDGTVALTSGTTVSTDAKLSRIFTLTLAHNATLTNPSNLQNSMSMMFRIKQDATGSRTLAYGSKFKFPGGAAPVLSTAVSAVDVLSCVYFSGDDRLECNMLKAFA